MDPDRDAFDELTALFTTEPEPKPTSEVAHLGLVGADEDALLDSEASEMQAMHVTVAICGHLPVMAGLWVTQFADRVGELHGATGLLRLEGGRCSLELFRTPRESARVDQGSSLLNSIEMIGQSVRRWIVCVDEKDAAEAVRAGVEEVAVLTGADKPAVLAAYRIAKTAAARVHSSTSLDIGLVVVGASEERASAVGEVLAVAAQEFMDRPLDVVDSIQRMDVVESARRMLFAERERATPSEAIGMLRSLAPELTPSLELEHESGGIPPELESVEEMDVEVELESKFESEQELDLEVDLEADLELELDLELDSTSESAPDVALRYVESETSEGLDVVPEVFPGRSRREVRLAPVVPPAPAAPRTLELVENIGVESEANAVTEIETETETETEIEVEVGIDIETQPEHSDAPMRAKVSPLRRHGEDGLCAHFPEFSRLEFRCPIAKSVELAVDSQGRLRLLCRDQELANAQMTQAWAQAKRATHSCSGKRPGRRDASDHDRPHHRFCGASSGSAPDWCSSVHAYSAGYSRRRSLVPGRFEL